MLTYGATFTVSYHQCNDEHQEEQSEREYADHIHKIILLFVCEGKVIDANEGLLVAIATAFIAAFTLQLRLSTDKLWAAQRDAFEKAERAFVFIDGFNIELTTAADSATVDLSLLPERYRGGPELFITRFAVQPRWKNGGNTPTRKMTIQTNWRGPLGPIPPEYGYKNSFAEPFFVAPQAIETSEFFEVTGVQSLIDYEMRYEGVRPMFWVWGRADYADVFGRSHFLEWCYRVRFERHRRDPLRASLIQWGAYNRSDEDGEAEA